MGISWSKPWFFRWGSRAEALLPEPSLLEHTYQYDGKVLIIGAGASGLAAARVLKKNNIDFSILEATDRHGGRLKEDTSFANFPVDQGAEFIHNLAGILDVLSGSPGKSGEIDLVRQWMTDSCSWDGSRLKKTSNLKFELIHRFFPEYKFKKSTWYEFVTKHVADGDVQDHIQLNAPVTEIDYSGSKVVVTTADGQKHKADKVIVTVSVGVLRSGNIKFVPNLPEEKQKALDEVPFHKGLKMGLKFSTKFYPEIIAVKFGSGGEKNFYDMAFGKGPTADHVLGLLATGETAEPYYSLASEEDIVKAVLEELDAMFDGEATRSFQGDYWLEDWGHKEFTQGTWVEGPRISNTTLASLVRPLESKIYFAGEATDTYQQMGVPGAVLSGYKAVHDMMT